MKSRKLAIVSIAVVALMASAVAAVSAAGPKQQKADFSAESLIQFVGPGQLLELFGITNSPDAITHIEVDERKNQAKAEEFGLVKRIVINTQNEGVLAFPTVVTACAPANEHSTDACGATGELLNYSSAISLHESNAKLTDVTTDALPVAALPPDAQAGIAAVWPGLGLDPVDPAAVVEFYSGNIKGKLDSTFSVLTPGGDTLVGSARLRIHRDGLATYSCTFVAPGPGGVPAFVPLPSFEFCTDDGPLGPLAATGGVLFLPALLDITDTGRFNIKPEEGQDVVLDAVTGQPVQIGSLTLKKLRGDLEVRVLAAAGQLIEPVPGVTINKIVIDPGRSVWLNPGEFKARFDATAGVGAVGPAHLLGGALGNPFLSSMQATTDVAVTETGNGGIAQISVTTVNEAVLNGAAPLIGPDGLPVIDPSTGLPIIVGDTLVGECTPIDPSLACDAVRALLDGSGLLSLHTSDAVLTKVDDIQIPVVLQFPGFPPIILAPDILNRWEALGLNHDGVLHAYDGKLGGSLTGNFLVQSLAQATPLVGAVELQIKGTGKYQCFESNGLDVLPGAAYCQSGTAEHSEYVANGLGEPLFLPSELAVVDRGGFLIAPQPGEVLVNGLALQEMKGDLDVTVNGLGGLVQPGSGIEVKRGVAKFVEN